ncbi:MAG TPA: hypothetical protein ENK02_11260 [Planctomycetes bacterium]|nr:hypothetical protein [Planctomycetota bacterium]
MEAVLLESRGYNPSSPVFPSSKSLLACFLLLGSPGICRGQDSRPSFAWTWADGGWEIHQLLPPSPPSKEATHVPLLRLRGILLHEVLSDGSTRKRKLPLRARKQDETHLYFEAELPREHHFYLQCRRSTAPNQGGHPFLSFRLRDEVGIRTRASRIALRFQWIRQGPPPRLVQVFPTAQGNLQPETAFGAPYLLLGDQRGSLALAPRVAGLRDKRRLPLFLSSRKEEGILLDLGFATTQLLSGRVIEAPAKAPSLREEDLVLEGRLHFFPNTPPDEALPALLSDLWIQGETEPALELLAGSWRQRREEETVRILHDLDRKAQSWNAGTSALQDLASPRGALMEAALILETLRDKGLHPSPLTPAERKLGTRAIGDTLALLRLAPGKSGLFRTHFMGDPKKKGSWVLHEKEPFSTEACARVALTLWSMRNLLSPPLSRQVQAKCARLAHFLRENQTPRGSIPAFFHEDLSPVRDSFFQSSAGALACGRFLLAFGRDRGEPKAIQAAISLMQAIEARHRNPPIPDPKLRLTAPKSFPAPLRAQTALDALALSLGLAKTQGGTPFLANARLWLLELSKLQVTAAAPRLQDRRRGAFLRSNLSLEISQGLDEVASSLIEAASSLGTPETLSRAREAIRFRLLGSESLSPAFLRDLNRIENRWGSLILDPQARNWCATENYRLSLQGEEGQRALEIAAGPAVRKETEKALPRGVFLKKGPSWDDWNIQGGLRSDRNPEKILIQPIPLNLLVYDPPLEVDRRADLPISARILDLSSPPSRAWLSFGPPLGPMGALPLKIRIKGNTALLDTTIPKAFLPDGERLLTQIHLLTQGRQLLAPRGRMAETTLGDSFLFDFNDPGSLHRLGIHKPRVSLSQGMGMGVPLGAGEALRLRLPIPAEALRVRLQLRVQGKVLVRAGERWEKRVLTREGDPFADRSYVLFEREDWSKGQGLALSLRGEAEGAALLRLRYSHEGRGSPLPLFEARVPSPRKPPAQARALVLPLSLGEAFAPSSQELALAFFGSGSSPSLRAWISRISQNKLSLSGKVLPWRSLPPPKKPSVPKLVRDALALHRDSLAKLPPPELLFIPFRQGAASWGSPTLLSPQQVQRIYPSFGAQKAPAILLFPLRGKSLPLGPPASLLLQLWSGLPAGSEGLGAFGPRFPGRRPTPSGRPSEPSGLSLFEAGWGRLYLARPHSLAEVLLPPLAQGGFLLELPIPLPGRERIFVEARSPSLLLPPPLTEGELLAIRDTRRAPKPMPDGGHPSYLSPAGSLPSRLRDPAGSGSTQGILVRTLAGERVWSIRPRAAARDGTQTLALEFLGKDLNPGSFRRSIREPGQSFFRTISPAKALFPRKRGGILRLECPSPLGGKEQRLFLQGEAKGLSELRVFLGDKPAFQAGLNPGPVRILLTLPANRGTRRLRLELKNLRPGSQAFILQKALSLPLEESLFQARNVAPRELERSRQTSPLSDGRYYSPTLVFPKSRSGKASIPLPVSIPPEGGILRVQAATSARNRSTPRPLVRVLFRPAGGGERRVLSAWTPLAREGEEIPLLRLDLSPYRGRTGFLILERKGSRGEVHLLECSIRRG